MFLIDYWMIKDIDIAWRKTKTQDVLAKPGPGAEDTEINGSPLGVQKLQLHMMIQMFSDIK